MRRRLAPALVCALVGLGAAAAAHAETYRCQGPDGKLLFTSDRSLCPGAARHETRGQLQRASGAPEPASARPREALRERRASDDEAEALVWRTRRARAESELEGTRERLGALRQVAGWCNRGHEVWATDQDGLRHGVDCGEIEAQHEALARQERRLEAYLAAGLEEECRRAGCLPGWIR